MLRTRLVTLLFGCLLLASASWADNLGYVDCSKYPENTQVLDKAGKTSGAVAFLPCGERFTILVRGEFFTQIQTKDGKVGYLNTYLISYDSPAAPKPQPSPAQTPAPASNAVAQSAASSKFKIIATTSSTPTPSAPAPASPAQASNVPAPTAAAAQPFPSAPAPAQASASASSVPAAQPQPAAPAQSAPASSAAAPTAPVTEAKPVAPPQVEVQPNASASSAAVASAPAPSPAAVQPQAATPAQTEAPPTASAPSTPAPQPTSSTTAAQPEPPVAAQPQPEPIRPTVEAPQVRPARPPRNPAPFPNVTTVPMMELFAGYGFTRFGGGNGTNLNGALGSFGWNFKPWLQIIGDASYNLVTVSGTKSVLYGDHFGPRIYLRARGARGPIPFVEGLVGGSRIDTTTAGVTTSKNGITYKAGGGIDLAISRHISVRAIEADYYRVPFLTASQTNYVASAGIIFRFGGRPRY